jgi:hypothetical protein
MLEVVVVGAQVVVSAEVEAAVEAVEAAVVSAEGVAEADVAAVERAYLPHLRLAPVQHE